MQRGAEELGQSTDGLLQVGMGGAGGLLPGGILFDGSVFGLVGVMICSATS